MLVSENLGTSRYLSDIDECTTLGAAACDNGGSCNNIPGDYTCDCTGTGYEGVTCENSKMCWI